MEQDEYKDNKNQYLLFRQYYPCQVYSTEFQNYGFEG